MKRSRNQEFVLGVTTIAILALLLGTVVFVRPLFRARGRDVVIRFAHEDGMAPLKVGSAVVLGGAMQVGTVRNVRVVQAESTTAAPEKRIYFEVRAQISAGVPLYGDSEITTGQPAIGGAGYVLIVNVGTPGVALEEPLIGKPPQSFGAAINELSKQLLGEHGLVSQLTRAVDPAREGSVMQKIVTSLDDINAMTLQLRGQLNPHEELALLAKLHRIIDHVTEMTAALRDQLSTESNDAALARVHGVLDQLDRSLTTAGDMLTESRPIVNRSLQSIEHATRSIDEDVVSAIATELDPENADALLAKLHEAMDRTNSSLASIEELSHSGERLATLARPTLERTLENFEGMSEQLRLASQEILLNPSKLIWGPNTEREAQLEVFQAARYFAEAARNLDSAAGRLEALLETMPADGTTGEVFDQELERIQTMVRAAFERFQRAEQALWDQLK